MAVADHQDGLSWSWDIDLEALLAAVSGPVNTQAPAHQDAELAEYLDAVEAGRARVVPLSTVAGRIAESLPTGPELAGWLATAAVTDLEDAALADMADSYRRMASWAQAGELSVVAEVASRSAAADDRIGVDREGRPARLPRDACAEVSLALTLSQASAWWWTELGVTLRWRLAATGAALRAGKIDLSRAQAIADATARLDDKTAREVEAKLLAGADAKTVAGLRAALRRAVIAADPEGAERRREEAERQARVTMYPDVEGTASLAGYCLPGVRAAAAMARITALARALQASGAAGGIDLLRSQVLLGLLLGTLPYIPPPPDAPPDQEPPDNGPPDDVLPDHTPPNDTPPDDTPPDDTPANDIPPNDGPPDDGLPDTDLNGENLRGGRDDGDELGARSPPAWPEVPAYLKPGPIAVGDQPIVGGLLDLRMPLATLTGDGHEPGNLGRLGPITPTQARYLAGLAAHDPAVRWRVILTDRDGRAVAVTRLTGRADQPCTGLIGQVTVIIDLDCLTGTGTGTGSGAMIAPIMERVLAAARSAAETATGPQPDGGCDHSQASAAYQPSQKLWDYVTARDLTCRFPTCRRPAVQCDLDHTTPFDQGGRTCSCNLGPLCRFHHQIKQHPRWQLTQPDPGTFIWTTALGRTYTALPDSHL